MSCIRVFAVLVSDKSFPGVNMERNEQGLPDGEGVMKEAVEVRSDKKT